MTELEKLRIVLNSPLCERESLEHIIPGRSHIYSEYLEKPHTYILKDFILHCIEEIESGQWPLYK